MTTEIQPDKSIILRARNRNLVYKLISLRLIFCMRSLQTGCSSGINFDYLFNGAKDVVKLRALYVNNFPNLMSKRTTPGALSNSYKIKFQLPKFTEQTSRIDGWQLCAIRRCMRHLCPVYCHCVSAGLHAILIAQPKKKLKVTPPLIYHLILFLHSNPFRRNSLFGEVKVQWKRGKKNKEKQI